MQWFIDVVTKRYAQFSGRARRKEFWMYVLFYFIGSIIVGILDRILGLDFTSSNSFRSGGWLSTIYWLALLIPSIAVGVRRLHDTNRTGWWILLWLTCIGIIVLIIFWALEGTPGDNKYGPDPKAAERGMGFGGPGGPAEPGYPTV
jgi:uncharacterized membrane protein YhaH (DUF805 family)